ncbi:PAC2 family protein [Candidatus Nitrosocosmicus oleophilus]|jgi:proteasome assembly chaperone (PAC2) family protein|uniref:PAC2 family protein n=2 Tax=Candidatus Nitrosocosmicus oleophilus TaxID=1353260 RepID=A0A654M429_9ARCH|nr:PAC2 family protein [Candidatus Nitrosocosmicus oleophilus]
MMNISIKMLKEIKLDNFVVFASLPDMGKVGGLVSEHLIKELQVEKFAEIGIFEKPWVKNEKGLVKPVIDTYDFYVNYENKVIIMTGKEQPQDPNNLINLCLTSFNIIKNIGIPKIIYTSGGYHQPQLAQAPKVYAVSTDKETVIKLKSLGINVFDTEIEVITWFNGVVLGVASEMKFNAIGLFGEIMETNEKQPLAAKSILKVFSILENISINTDGFDLEYENQMLDKSKRIDNDGNTSKKSGPGIG